MEFNDFIHSTGQWLMGTGTNANIVMSSRIRLARNLAKKPFTNKARKKELLKNENRLVENLIASPEWHDPVMAGYWIWAASCWIPARGTRLPI